MASQSTLEIRNIHLRYRSVEALRDVSTSLSTGVNGLLGPNGAGKTTLFRIITAGLQPTSGSVLWEGHSINDPRWKSLYLRDLGFLPQDPGWFERFSVRELCSYFARLRGISRGGRESRVDECIDMVGLSEKANSLLKHLSGGERRRAFLAQTIVHDPKILVLDEPTAGLDPIQRIEFRKLVSSLAATRIVLISTHLVEDVVHIARKIVILHQGVKTWEGSPEELSDLGKAIDITESESVSLPERGFLSALRGMT